MAREPLEQSRKLVTELPGPKARELREQLETYVPKALSPSTPAFAARAEGGIVEDVDGNRLIDLGSGIAVTTVGASHPKIVDAVQSQVADFTHTCFMVTPYDSYTQLAKRLDEIVPISGPTRTVLLNSGAEAVENAVKIARSYTGKQAIASFDNAYHGRTTLTMGLTAKNMPYKDSFGPFASELYRVPGSYPYRDGMTGPEAAAKTIEALETQIGAQNLAAVIMEPIQGEGGFIVPAEGFLAEVVAWCKANDVLFIADEIQTGFVRTGQWFASTHENIEPDLITLAKGIAGGMPLSAVTGRAEVMDSVHTGGLGGTYGGNPVAVAAGIASLEVMEEENLAAKALRIQEVITEHFQQVQQTDPRVGDIRGRGAMMAVEFVDPQTKAPLPDLVNEIAAAARLEGVITLTAGTYGNVLRFLPPVVIGEDLLKEGLSVITDILAQTKNNARETANA